MKWLAAACLLLCVLCRIASGNLAPDAHGAVIDRDDPYGTAASAGKELRVGHKGLFFDRFDAGISDPVTGAETPRLWPGARHSGYARNRTLHCNFQRWNQPDPNMTGLPVQASIPHHGQELVARLQEFDLHGHFGDGANVYLFLGGHPLTANDPTGLQYDPFDDAFGIAWEHALSGMSVLSLAKQFSWEKVRKIRAYERAGWAFDELIMDRDEAILFSMVVGPFFSHICFEAGTPVVLADGSMSAIETLPLGSTVLSAVDPHASDLPSRQDPADPDAHDRIDPVMWRSVDLTLDDAERGTIRVTLLRPLEWFQVTGVRAGSEIALNLSEMDIRGTAHVVAIGPCPEVRKPQPGGQVVTGTIVTERAHIVRVWLEGASEPIGTTPSHPFYSDDREAWVSAGGLREGESVRTLAGSKRIKRIEPVDKPATVYNFEIHRSHTYYVGECNVLVHNECTLVSRVGRDSRLAREAQSAGRTVQRSLDELQSQLAKGNMNPGIGTKAAGFGNIMYARARDGARLFFRATGDVIEILAKAYKGNEDRVFRLLRELYGN